MKNITVVILGGGDSTRFWPLKDKLFMNFLGKPILYYRLKQLQKYGLTNVVVISSEKNEGLFQRFQNTYPEFEFELVRQTDKRGMGGALLSLEEKIKEKEILVLKPVDLFEDILLNQLEKILREKPENVLTGFTTSTYFPGGYLNVRNGQLVHIVEKPKESKTPSNIVRIVFDYFKNASIFLKFLKSSKTAEDDLYEVAIGNMVNEGYQFKIIQYKGYWGYLQYPWHTLSVSALFLSKLKGQNIGKTKIDSSATIKGDVFIEDGVQILENAKIVGPTYIGKNTLVGNNVIIRESMIGENCVLGFATEVTRSFIGNNCWFHSNYIGDSVIDDNVGIGGGTIFANYRLDEQTVFSYIGDKRVDTKKTKLGVMVGENVRIGVNTSIMPGVKIGRNTFIGAGLNIESDVENDKLCVGKTTLVIKDNKRGIKGSPRDKLKLNLKV